MCGTLRDRGRPVVFFFEGPRVGFSRDFTGPARGFDARVVYDRPKRVEATSDVETTTSAGPQQNRNVNVFFCIGIREHERVADRRGG